MTTAGKRRNVGILVFDEVEVLDFAGPFEVLSRARLQPGVESRRSDESAPFRVFTVAAEEKMVTAVGGLKVEPEFTFASAPRIDVLVVPGGFGTRRLLSEPKVLAWLSTHASSAELVTSVCTGALLLAECGALGGCRATTHWGALDVLEAYPDVEVERELRWVEDRVITSAGVAAGIDMAFAVVARFCGEEVADETAHYIEYQRREASA